MSTMEATIRAIVREEIRRALTEWHPPAQIELALDSGPSLYSVATVADRLEVSTDYVYDRIKAGELPVVELGHGRAKQRVRADVLMAFIDSRSTDRTHR